MILDNKNLIGITALLIHAAKIDENFSEAEKKVIKNFINVYSESILSDVVENYYSIAKAKTSISKSEILKSWNKCNLEFNA